MEVIQGRRSSLLKRTATVARTVASAGREQEQRAPDKEQEHVWDGRGRGGPRPMAGKVEELRDGQRPHGKGRGEGAERGVLGAPVDAELRQGKAPRSETERRARRSWKREEARKEALRRRGRPSTREEEHDLDLSGPFVVGGGGVEARG